MKKLNKLEIEVESIEEVTNFALYIENNSLFKGSITQLTLGVFKVEGMPEDMLSVQIDNFNILMNEIQIKENELKELKDKLTTKNNLDKINERTADTGNHYNGIGGDFI